MSDYLQIFVFVNEKFTIKKKMYSMFQAFIFSIIITKKNCLLKECTTLAESNI